jgi:K+-sensing histidine kinase KdpD
MSATKNKSENKNENAPTIIVCIDTSSASRTTLRYACRKAKTLGFNIHILAVLEASHKNLLFGSRAISDEKRQQIDKHLDRLIKNICEEFKIIPAVAVREGDIVTEIISELKLVPNCRLLVFGKSNTSLSDNTVLPKLVGKVGNRIAVPVTIVPENLSKDLLEIL